MVDEIGRAHSATTLVVDDAGLPARTAVGFDDLALKLGRELACFRTGIGQEIGEDREVAHHRRL